MTIRWDTYIADLRAAEAHLRRYGVKEHQYLHSPVEQKLEVSIGVRSDRVTVRFLAHGTRVQEIESHRDRLSRVLPHRQELEIKRARDRASVILARPWDPETDDWPETRDWLTRNWRVVAAYREGLIAAQA